MTESKPPRVRVTLPGGRVVEGQLLGWRQQAGEWLPRVAIEVPAAAVEPVDGEDYSRVPREPAGQRYVIHRLPPLDGKPRRELHLAGCWVYPRDPFLTTRVDTAEEAAGLLGEGVVTCKVCRPVFS
jgi:hypothetical protein